MGKPPVQWGSGVPIRAMPVGLCVAVVTGHASAQMIDQKVPALPLQGVDVSAGENGMEGRQPCALPTHWCVEGLQIQSGEYCTAYCPAGFTPDVDRLRCQDGILVPNLYKCEKGRQKKNLVSLISALLAFGICGLFIIGMICSGSSTGSKVRESGAYDNQEEIEELEPLAGPASGSPTSQPLLATDLDQE
eukprot:s732_g3.t1